MKILCVIDSLGSGGAQRQLVGLAIGFKERGHEVSFLIYHEDFFFKYQLDEAFIPVHTIIESNYLYRLVKIRRYIRRGNFDSVISFLEAANFICEISSLPWRKWNLIVGERNANPRITKSLKLRVYRLFHFLADFIVSNSATNIKMVLKANPFIPKRKLKVIYNFVNIPKSNRNSKYTYRKDGKITLLIIARHQYQKNLINVVSAVDLLPEIEKRVLQIDWYGGDRGDNSKEIALKKIDNLGLNSNFNFFAPIPNIECKIQEADAIGLFSHFEGLPNVICEAMIAGKAVVSSSVSDLPEIIKCKKLLCNPKDIHSIKKAISHLLNLSEAELNLIGNENKKTAEVLFDRENIISSYLILLQNKQ